MNWVRIAAVTGFLGVVLGAFGAHGLETRLEAADRLATWETAVFYHLVHALALLALGRTERGPEPVVRWSLLLGIVLFSGSLYVLCLTGIGMLGAVTPFGGVAFLLGWGWLVFKPAGKTA